MGPPSQQGPRPAEKPRSRTTGTWIAYAEAGGAPNENHTCYQHACPTQHGPGSKPKDRTEARERIERRAREPDGIDTHLRALDGEWDVERVLELNASILALTGIALGALVDKRWLWLPAAVTGFLALHAVQGWCPPIPLLRRMGVRTQREIEVERHALKLLRGDYRELSDPDEAREIPEAIHAAAQRG